MSKSKGFYEARNMVRFDVSPEDIIDPDEALTYFEFPAYRQLPSDEAASDYEDYDDV